MEVKKIKTTNNDGTISEIEVSFDVWQFDKDDFWKQDYQNEKWDKFYSYDEICHRQEIGEIAKIPKQLAGVSAESEYIKTCKKQKNQNLIIDLLKALNSLSEKQKRRIKMKYFDNLNSEQIAQIEKCSKRAVNYTINASIKFLKNYFKGFNQK